jgi:hypothetical protein
MLPATIDFSTISTLNVARELLGPESKERSTATEKHFPDHGGLFVNVAKNKWYSHGNDTGGDALDLVVFKMGCDKSAGISWLRSRGLVQQQQPSSQVVATYDYVSEDGEVLYHVDRCLPKTFWQWREIDGERLHGVTAGLYERSKFGGPWKKVKGERKLGAEVRQLPGVRYVPYRLPELLQSGDAPVLIPGGEKDVDNLRALGFVATCNHGGEGKWYDALSEWFKGRRVFLLCDDDEQGEKHQAIVGAALNGVAAEIPVTASIGSCAARPTSKPRA